ncbi:MAG: tetratricopeptide repeat protein [Zymomonas mobilis subsp. pomaceae]|uniref:Tetratricopeptide TPR_2 repeat protein n=1 Tax=Zymomonas mobilis subsp. pomaceae (strain ATCC 29192 / DSM 22645 / JCM 10191 / CCUG 17912 / NBRC 13757 / NCIMB 11200 / NRRL B-4491 / Barker I) TaxID=579138 RepID=F8ETL2_ZYMMT|nr:tetratricopeptide repeat protein [Zymomonas mobilis]AEI37022.1 Tetratricopeptide TPR_2 repeat protein [Zymomonas mobilis subsp. pomaceae ATCC 29192]MDX5948394.1 tetratricopeptide repeat protein [Zymomonas mobilis subsp. pomaceae]
MISFLRFVPLTALLAVPFAAADARKEAVSPFKLYVEGQVASFSDNPDLAARNFFSVLQERPGDNLLALRTYRQAQIANNMSITLGVLSRMEKDGYRTGDGPFLILADAVKRHKWKEANLLIDRMSQFQYPFFFTAPLLRAWVILGSKKGDPFSALDKAQGPVSNYVQEERGLLLLATGKYEEALSILAPVMTGKSGRSNRLRIIVAGIIAHRDIAKSRALLEGSSASLAKARMLLDKNKKIFKSKLTAEDGLSELILRLASVMGGQSLTAPIGLGLARASSWLTPDNPESWLITAEILSSGHQFSAARSALDHISSDDPFYNLAMSMRILLYVRENKKEDALNLARTITQLPNATADDWRNLAELEGDNGHYEAALVALDRIMGPDQPMAKDWQIWLLKGTLLDSAGHWPEAKAAYQQAVALAPDQPLALNTLGYSQLEKRENIPEAARLIEQALKVTPNDPAIIDSMGWSQYLLGHTDQAILLLEQAAKADPKEPTIYEHLGDAYWTVGRHFEARYAWQASLGTADDKATTRLKQKIAVGLTPTLAAP